MHASFAKSLLPALLIAGICLPLTTVAQEAQQSRPKRKKSQKTTVQKPQPDEEVVFKTVGDVELSLHVFLPQVESGVDSANDSGKPAIVFFFGGGWNGGTPSQFYGQSRRLADLGMVAFCAEYRVKSKHKTEPKVCVSDGKSAIRWVRANAKRYGIDADRIAAGGGSAGGHVASACATVTKFDDPQDDLDVSCIPAALVLFNPVYDNGPEGYGYSRVEDYWQDFSPMHLISATTPPATVFLGTKDKLIPVATAKQFQSKMQDLGVRSELHLYEGEGHGFFNKGQSYADTLEKTEQFLRSLGYVK